MIKDDLIYIDHILDSIYSVWETIETNLPQLKRQLLSIKK